MFWYKKEEKKGLPDLPPLKPVFTPQAPEEEEEEIVEKHALPSFPDSAMKKGFAQAAIKEAVRSIEEEEKAAELPELPEREEFTPKKPIITEIIPSEEKTKDIYVKIDRFSSARKSLKTAREKLAEIENLLKKIRETRMREEQELSFWEKEVEAVKSKVEDVTRNIFEKV